MALEAYQSYWSSQGYGNNKRRRRMAKIRDKAGLDGWGKAGDPLGAQTPMVQDNMLSQLARRASGENGRIDDWQSLIDPTVSYGSNLRKILEKGGKELDSTIEKDRENFIQSADSRAKRHAKKRIRENIQAIDAGEKAQLVDDIAGEFGAEFAAAAVEEAKALELPADPAGAPDPAEPEKPAEPKTPAEPESPKPAPNIPDPADRPNLVKSAEPEKPAEPSAPTAGADPSDSFDPSDMGLIKLLITAVIALVLNPVLSDKSQNSAEPPAKQATIDSYA